MSTSEPSQRAVLGSVLIYQRRNFRIVDDLGRGAGDLADLIPGASVVIRDLDGSIVGETTLEAGVLSPEGNCRMRFLVHVPELDRYVVTIGGRRPDTIIRQAMREHEEDGIWRLTLDWDLLGGIRPPMNPPMERGDQRRG